MISSPIANIMLTSMLTSCRKGLISMNGIARKGLLSYRDNNPAVGRTSSKERYNNG